MLGLRHIIKGLLQNGKSVILIDPKSDIVIVNQSVTQPPKYASIFSSRSTHQSLGNKRKCGKTA